MAGERDLLMRALAKTVADGLVQVTWAPTAIWADLQELLLGRQWHVPHFVGNGGFDTVQDEGVLVLTDEHGRADPVEAHRFCDLLHEPRPQPQLVVQPTVRDRVGGVLGNCRARVWAGPHQYAVLMGENGCRRAHPCWAVH